MAEENNRLLHLVTALPAVLALLIVILSLKGVWGLNRVSHERIHQDVESYLSEKEGFSFPLTGEESTVTKGELESLDDSHKVIFVFGGSSVIRSDGETFPTYLEKILKREKSNVTIVNFGWPGIDSFSVKRRLQDVMKEDLRSPDVIVLYMGHNDYNNAYYYGVYEHFDELKWIMRISYQFWHMRTERSFKWYLRANRGRLLKILQQARIVSIWDSNYGTYNGVILDYFKENLNDIIQILDKENIPLIILTPIGNLHAEPYGDIERVTGNYYRGLSAKSYEESIQFLITARDEEILTDLMRAKSDLVQHIQTLESEGVYVFDLQDIFIGEGFGFGNDEFIDHLHMNDKTHQRIAKSLSQYILEHPELNQTLSGPKV